MSLPQKNPREKGKEKEKEKERRKKKDGEPKRSSSSSKKNEAQSVGPFILGKTLGIGATGKVKLGCHKESGLQVAIKIVNKDIMAYKPNMRKKIEREIAVMKLMDHPSVLQFIDVYETQKHLFLVTEYVGGGELFDYLVKKGYLEAPEALHFFSQIILGIDFCHRHMICHRDLKPENILIDSSKNVKIGDFGMAALMRTGTMLETSCGSPHYASPEVVMGLKYDGRAADVWSCGVILYALLTGKLPFDDDNIRKLLDKVKAGQFFMPNYISKDVRELIHGMLTVDVAKRITMDQIKEHPWIQSGLAKTIANNPLYKYADMDSSSDIIVEPFDEEVLNSMVFMGWGRHIEDLKEVLVNDQRNFEKVFYKLLQKRKVASHQRRKALGKKDTKAASSNSFSGFLSGIKRKASGSTIAPTNGQGHSLPKDSESSHSSPRDHPLSTSSGNANNTTSSSSTANKDTIVAAVASAPSSPAPEAQQERKRRSRHHTRDTKSKSPRSSGRHEPRSKSLDQDGMRRDALQQEENQEKITVPTSPRGRSATGGRKDRPTMERANSLTSGVRVTKLKFVEDTKDEHAKTDKDLARPATHRDHTAHSQEKEKEKGKDDEDEKDDNPEIVSQPVASSSSSSTTASATTPKSARSGSGIQGRSDPHPNSSLPSKEKRNWFSSLFTGEKSPATLSALASTVSSKGGFGLPSNRPIHEITKELQRALKLLGVKYKLSDNKRLIKAKYKSQEGLRVTMNIEVRLVQEDDEENTSFVSFIRRGGDSDVYRSLYGRIQQEIKLYED